MDRLPFIPVKFPDGNLKKPVKVGKRRDLTYRALRVHLAETRAASLRKRKKSGRLLRHFERITPPRRPNPELIYWHYVSGHGYYLDNDWTESSVQTLRYSRTYSSVETPGFRSIKRKSQLPVNPYSLSLIKTLDPMGIDRRICTDIYPYDVLNTSADISPSSNWTSQPAGPVHDEQAHNQALARMIDRAEIGLNGNIAQDLAQFSQMTNMIADSAIRIAKSLRHVKNKEYVDAWNSLSTPSIKSRGLGYRVSGEGLHLTRKTTVIANARTVLSKKTLPTDLNVGKSKTRIDIGVQKGLTDTDHMSIRTVDIDVGRAVSPVKSVAENWLALQYGWKPLMSDIFDALNSLAKYCIEDPVVVRTMRGKAKTYSREKTVLTDVNVVGGNLGTAITGTYSYCTIGCRYTIDSKMKAFAAQTGFTNPINLAWEVLPYSFVVDWFLPIGPYLTTLSAFDGLAFYDGFESKITKQYFSSDINYQGKILNTPYKVTRTMIAKFYREWIIVNRVKLLSFPSATMPSFKNPLSVVHALNALALLRAAFK